MIEKLLGEMAALLNSDGINYSVFLQAYSGIEEIGSGIDSIVAKLIGHNVVMTGMQDIKVDEIVGTLHQSLSYVGGEGAGPGERTIGSKEFSRLLGSIRDSVVQLSESACEIKAFEFAKGHPAYPVFWDFAYIFLGKDQQVLLVGSSSD